MTGAELALVLTAWAVAAASPGPATLTIASAAMGEGRRQGVLTGLGVLGGSAAWGLAAMGGMSALMLSQGWIVEALRYAGAAYLGWLALKSLRAALRASAGAMPAPRRRGLPPVWRGFLVHLTNPKAIFSWGAVFAVLVPPGAPMADLLTLYLSLGAVSGAVFLGYGVLFSTDRVVAGYRRAGRWLDAAFAVLFGAAAVKILTARLG
ncbi:LysE family translocator [Roseicyclus persicicus]|uniref:LysE family translocator n=1 Tax=Roseicyclus persicicus TaxID=2650661 RepID=A0A7X6JXQ7_9RHOB|nr:LysE family translocator [Roseibacterium persicicum]NKX43018.1 LysE family translocator [Roseibacterium persicicum]